MDNPSFRSPKQRIAVIGAGVAGVVAADLLQRRHDVTLFEKNPIIGGHTNTIVIPDGPDQGLPVDTGFIVFNNRTYPLFEQWLAELGVEAQNSTMSFSYHQEKTGFHYAGNDLNGVFAQRRNLLRPTFWQMIRDLIAFNRKALSDLNEDRLGDVTLGEYVRQNGWSEPFLKWYLLPMGAAIWSCPTAEMLFYPAKSFLAFFRNHGLLTVQDRHRLQWKTVRGGSHSYLKAFLSRFRGQVVTNAGISSIHRIEAEEAWKIQIRFEDGREEQYDRVVIATHADEALKLLGDPDRNEKMLLGAWNYSKNHAVLHTDASVLPPSKRAWAAWNYAEETQFSADHPVSVTYNMNILQSLQTKQTYCVTLNRNQPIFEKNVIREMNYMHPVYTWDSMRSQAELPKLNGVRNTYFCGSYFGYGFHEDAVRSSVQMVETHFGFGLNEPR